ncbi:HNH endonuclease [Actinoallomurus sp. CA-150999]|uniref:HNH endonuclease n=1 Tax=Actinoallomurus sp. CA-150999 TaxID=3239887 RepID=UPI003D93B496
MKAWFAEHASDGGLPERIYVLARESGHARIQMVEAIAARFFDDFDESGLLTAVGLYDQDVATDEDTLGRATVDPKAEYARWCDSVARQEAATYGRRRTRIASDLIRLSLARRAVLIRSQGRCENPECGRPAPDVNDHGEPVLEVDHVDQISDGGRDHPIQMIALCPDCHAVKTRGRSRHRLIPLLARTARDLHDRWNTTETSRE